MKYFKFTQISAETGISWLIEQPVSGPSLPHTLLPGLGYSVRVDKDYYVGAADDSAQANPANYIFEITKEEYSEWVKKDIMHGINMSMNRLYEEEKILRQRIFGKYDSTASVAGVYKYEQAIELLANPAAAAPDVRVEAAARGVDVLVLAQRIKINHEDFKTKDAKIAGIRGKLLDRYNSYTFNDSDPVASFIDYFSTEQIGEERIIPGMEDSPMRPVIVNKYALALDQRFKFA